MNHADRERLSQLLALAEANIIADSDPYADSGALGYVREARAIVDAPAPPQRTIPEPTSDQKAAFWSLGTPSTPPEIRIPTSHLHGTRDAANLREAMTAEYGPDVRIDVIDGEVRIQPPDIRPPDIRSQMVAERLGIAPEQRTIPPNPGYSPYPPPPPYVGGWRPITPEMQAKIDALPDASLKVTLVPAREVDLEHLNSIWATRDRAERTRNRAWAAALALTAATAIALALVSGDAPPTPGPTVRVTPDRPLATPSGAAQDRTRANLPTRTEGTGQ